jgi:glycosyltransferase involved in cell wall biosynthesis
MPQTDAPAKSPTYSEGTAIQPANVQRPRELRTLHVISSLAPKLGGSVECAKQITAALMANMCDVEIVCVDSPASAWLRNYGPTVHALGRPTLDLFYSPSYDLLRWMSKNVARFDVVIVHGLWQFHSVAAALACSRAGIPYLVYTHGMLMRNSLFNDRLKLAKKAVYWTLVERWVLSAAAAVLYTSENEQNWSNVDYFRISCRVENIGNGIAIPIEAAQYSASNATIQRSRIPTLLALGRLHPVKGLDTLLKATHLLGDDAPLVLIAGTGDSKYEEFLRDLSKSLNLMNKVSFVGEVAGRQKWHLLATSWALVAPSLHENFGLAIVEALSVGTPAIVTNDVGIWQQIEIAGAGIAYRGGPDTLASVIQEFLRAPDECRLAMSENAKNCYVRHFSISAPAIKLIALIQSMLGPSN